LCERRGFFVDVDRGDPHTHRIETPEPTPLTPSHWKLDDRYARLAITGMTATLDRLRPLDGLVNVCFQGQEIPGLQWLGIDAPVEPFDIQVTGDTNASQSAPHDADWYQRGGDLVATYHETPDLHLRVQAYWRVVANLPATVIGIDLLASVQTSRLDADPERMATSRLPSADVFRLEDEPSGHFVPVEVADGQPHERARGEGPACWLFRPPNADWSYVELVHPDDARRDRLTRDVAGLRLIHHLFAGELEKGVILRARLRGALLPRADDQRWALEAYRGLLHARLPLTT
jgi:hypothetical protein